jgi:hypothetical protein
MTSETEQAVIAYLEVDDDDDDDGGCGGGGDDDDEDDIRGAENDVPMIFGFHVISERAVVCHVQTFKSTKNLKYCYKNHVCYV